MTHAETSTEPLNNEDWAGEMGQRWLANLDRFEAMLAPIGQILFDRAAFVSGERVIDLGCGGGATTLGIAKAIGDSGHVTGLDISPDLISTARLRASEVEAKNVDFVCADAATAILPMAPYDRLFSRFGSMFFPDPIAAFTHLRSQLNPGGRIDLAVWGPPRENGWMMAVMGVLRSHIEVPPAIPRAPGPFALEDKDYLQTILVESGCGYVSIDSWQGEQAIGGPDATPEQAAHFIVNAMAAGRLARAAGEAVAHAVEQDLVELFVEHHQPGLGVMLPAKVWMVSATA